MSEKFDQVNVAEFNALSKMNSITKLPTPPVFYWFNTYSKKLAVIKPSKQFSTNISFAGRDKESIDRSRPLWRWTCLVTTSSFHLGSFPVLLPVFCCLISYRQTPLSPLPNLFCLPQILFSGGEQLTHTGPPYAPS